MSKIITFNETRNKCRQSKEFTDLQFVARAVSLHDEIRSTFACIHSTGAEIVGTNTRILLRATSDVLPNPGDYYVIKRTKRSIWLHNNGDESFPQWEKLLYPEWQKRPKITVDLDAFSFDRSYFDLIRALPAGSGLKYEYMEMLRGYRWTVYFPSLPTGPIIFTSDNKMALVMLSSSQS